MLSALVPDVVIDTEPVPVTTPPEPAKIPTAPLPVVVRLFVPASVTVEPTPVAVIPCAASPPVVTVTPSSAAEPAVSTPTADTPAPDVEIVVAGEVQSAAVVGAGALEGVSGRRRRAGYDETAGRRDLRTRAVGEQAIGVDPADGDAAAGDDHLAAGRRQHALTLRAGGRDDVVGQRRDTGIRGDDALSLKAGIRVEIAGCRNVHAGRGQSRAGAVDGQARRRRSRRC